MDFKIDDTVVYISHGGEWHQDAKLIIGNKYTITSIMIYNDEINIFITKNGFPYNNSRFITLNKYRKLKIQKIKNKKYEF